MMRRWMAWAGCSTLCAGPPLAAQLPTPPDWSLKVERPARRALVIGITGYDNARQLKTPRVDADQFEKTLWALNFKSVDRTPGVDRVDRDAILAAIDGFTAKLKQGDLAVVYYSGHGVQDDGINYLVGSDGTANPDLPGLDWVSVDYVLGEVKRTGAAVAIVLLDACRADPVTGTAEEDRDVLDPSAIVAASGGSQGLAPAGGPPGPFVIAFAAQPKMAAYSRFATDPPTMSSIYTRSLAARLQRNAPLGRALAGVDADVVTATGGRQTPMSSMSWVWDLPLDGAKPDSSTTEEDWASVVNTTPIGQLVAQLTDFLTFHPVSEHAAAAREQLARLASQPTPAPSPPQPRQPDLPKPADFSLLLGALQSTRIVDGDVTAVTNAQVTVRQRRKAGADLGIVPAGLRVRLVETKGGFARIIAPDGRFGWIGGVRTADRQRVNLDVRLGFAGGDEYADAKDWSPLGDAARKLSAGSTAVTIRTGKGSVSDVGQARLVGRLRALRIRDYVVRLGVPPERVVMLENDPATAVDEAHISVLKVTS